MIQVTVRMSQCRQWYHDASNGPDIMTWMLATMPWCWCSEWDCHAGNDTMTLILAMILIPWCWQGHHYTDASNNANADNNAIMLMPAMMLQFQGLQGHCVIGNDARTLTTALMLAVTLWWQQWHCGVSKDTIRFLCSEVYIDNNRAQLIMVIQVLWGCSCINHHLIWSQIKIKRFFFYYCSKQILFIVSEVSVH